MSRGTVGKPLRMKSALAKDVDFCYALFARRITTPGESLSKRILLELYERLRRESTLFFAINIAYYRFITSLV